MKKLHKEYSLDLNDYINIKYGSVNRDIPKVVYVNGSGWIKPIADGNYEEIINDAFYKFRNKLKKIIISSPLFENKFVCDFDLKTTSLKIDKKNYLSFEFYVKQNNVVKLKDIKTQIKYTFQNVINDLVDELNKNIFIVTKSKN